ncbi:MAG TPA: hypothetical protein VGN05_13980 [Parvibaculum sp.]
MRVVVWLIVVGIVAVVVVPVACYGTVDPCRMLAKSIADEGYQNLANAVGAKPGKTPEAAETLGRMMVSQYSQGECVMKLKDRWLGLDKPAQ